MYKLTSVIRNFLIYNFWLWWHVTIQETPGDCVRYPSDAVRTNEGRYGEIGDGAVQPPWFLEAILMEWMGSYL